MCVCVCHNMRYQRKKPKPALRPPPTGRRHAGHAREHIPGLRYVDRKLFSIFFWSDSVQFNPPHYLPVPLSSICHASKSNMGGLGLGRGQLGRFVFSLISSQSHIGDFGDWGWDIDRQTFLFEKKLHSVVSHTFDQQVVGSTTTVCSSSWK